MKKFIILGGFLLLASQTFAQTFAFFRDGAQLANNTEITITNVVPGILDGELVLEARLELKNMTDDYVDAKMIQTILSEFRAPAGFISFCLDGCTTVKTTELLDETKRIRQQFRSFEPYQLLVSPAFKLEFDVEEGGYTGATARYEIFPEDNVNDKTTITVTYDYTENSTGLSPVNSANQTLVRQNESGVEFIYSFDSGNHRLEVYNLLGQKVAQHNLDTHSSTFILPEKLVKGVYLYSIKEGNRIVTAQKFSIR
ncbi:MAG: hypothetical protein EZS26_001598 [Candidatus Ordinivivax streblomastigis]|uniref:Secretion system C-terminal sorting domain-containing protein n=1 Tax=Candidatus Ordinivivax streblomastigis TaxID=2540710 RepID=A0A5M8P1H3_9BACT|nr:MAG: hypothetical protein EZS26_001598 [Candidatus Ordinivivax streblomastigis]